MNTLSVKPLSEADIPLIIQYWLGAEPDFLRGMGVDLDKMPTQQDWEKSLLEQLSQPIPEKKSYCIIWQVDGQAVGHSNINKIQFGEEAYIKVGFQLIKEYVTTPGWLNFEQAVNHWELSRERFLPLS